MPRKTASSRRKSARSRSAQLKKARECRGSKAEPEPVTPTNAPGLENSPSPPVAKLSASKRKLLYADESSMPPSPCASTAYLLCEVGMLQGLFNGLLCPVCKTPSLYFECSQDQNMGMAAKLLVNCAACESPVTSCDSSSKISSQAYDVNRRAALAIANIGLGHAALKSFCEVFSLKPLGETSYLDAMSKIYEAASRGKKLLLDSAASKVREAYQSSNIAEPDEDGVLDITVSYDGSWPTRGRRSKHGVGCIIESLTGLVLDYEAMSVYCQRCETIGERLKITDPHRYEEWMEAHAADCLINHSGSSGAMEVQAAKTLWGRSLERGFRYTTMISDGDCKTFNELLKDQPYGKERVILKEECVNHFAKRVGTALRNVVEGEKARGVTLGGNRKGSLTVKKMATLQTYFQRAILDNPGSIQGMRNAVWATYFHAISTDENPQHQNCPTGVESWCTYNKAKAQDLPPPPHKTSVLMNDRVAAYIKPVYERLTSDELLGRCLQGKTQNANESLHSVIWGFCPKTTFVGAQRVRLALYLGAGQFNCGSASLRLLMSELDMLHSQQTLVLGQRRDSERVERAEKNMSVQARSRREKRRAAHLRAQDDIEAAEGGPAYAAGAF